MSFRSIRYPCISEKVNLYKDARATELIKPRWIKSIQSISHKQQVTKIARWHIRLIDFTATVIKLLVKCCLHISVILSALPKPNIHILSAATKPKPS